ncbi:MAG: tyramine oxidase [Rhodospirillaceae bacterium]|jgi:primary-amine oxidase|nr:tyramine oxidase [Rhodospirillaceae bacterium]MBT5566736.1 tyramine oxidase [Rhodospirillaceae bacterium]MBT6090798.1 tyramine oxidase [Rhodospirillaceae bacterium]
MNNLVTAVSRHRYLIALVLLFVAFVVFSRSPSETGHPLDSLSADEIDRAIAVLRDEDHIGDRDQVPMVSLLEMSKDDVLAWEPGDDVSRTAFVNVRKDGVVYEAEIDVVDEELVRWEAIPGVQTNQIFPEFMAAGTLMEDERWQVALNKRGYDDLEDVSCVPVTPGYFGAEIEQERRLGRVYCFDKTFGGAHTFAHPIEGLYALVDLDTTAVLDIIDTGVIPVPTQQHDYEELKIELRDKLNPIRIMARRGNNYTFQNNVVSWQNWSFHTSFDRRVGLILSLVTYDDGDEARSVAYQLHPSEMFVPYMDAGPGWYFRTFLDVGEYGFGSLSTSLKPGTDCPAHATFQDVTLPDDRGGSYVKSRAFCIFERDTGRPAWRHAADNGAVLESRPDVELVVRSIPTIGNYDYVIDYVFTLHGNIRVDVGATGIDAVKGVVTQNRGDESAAADLATGELVAPGLVAVYHDHYISFRLDLDVDGPANSVEVMEVVPQTLPADNPRRSLWSVSPRLLETEGAVDKAPAGQVWRVINENQETKLGHHPGFHIEPGHQALSVLAPDDFPQMRAAFTAKPLWVTQYNAMERHAAGLYPTQSRGGDGLPQWVADQSSIRNEDVVLWYTVGFRHVTRVEDWPMMPTKWHSFTLRPFNFFERNPALDLPSTFR